MTKEQMAMDELRKRFAAPVIIEPAVVKSVDQDELTCEVQLLDDTIIADVRLKAAIDEVTDGLVQIPVIDSSVLVARIGNETSTRFVLAFSNVDRIEFYGGENGPIVIWEAKLKLELDKVKDLLSAILGVLNGAPIPEPGSGAASALQAALKSAVTGKPEPDFENLTDNKIKH